MKDQCFNIRVCVSNVWLTEDVRPRQRKTTSRKVMASRQGRPREPRPREPRPEAAPSWWSATGAFASGSKEQERSSLQRMRNLPSTPLWQEHWACVHAPAHLCTTESGHHLQSPGGRGPPPVCLAGLKVYTRL